MLVSVNEDGYKTFGKTIDWFEPSSAVRVTVASFEGRSLNDKVKALNALAPTSTDLTSSDADIDLVPVVDWPSSADRATSPIDSLDPSLDRVTKYKSYEVAGDRPLILHTTL